MAEVTAKTKTFAEIYESQGHYADAMKIYIDLLIENPLDNELPDKIKRLQAIIAAEKKKKEKILNAQLAGLNTLLNKFLSYRAI